MLSESTTGRAYAMLACAVESLMLSFVFLYFDRAPVVAVADSHSAAA
jgi:hypothetical protein